MTNPQESIQKQSGGKLDLTHQTLDQWEAELDEFAVEIRQRLASVSPSACEPMMAENDGELTRVSEEHQSLEVLRSIRELSR